MHLRYEWKFIPLDIKTGYNVEDMKSWLMALFYLLIIYKVNNSLQKCEPATLKKINYTEKFHLNRQQLYLYSANRLKKDRKLVGI